MTSRVRFVLKPEGVRELKREPAMGVMLEERAREVEAEAKRLAPVGSTRRYVEGIEATVGLDAEAGGFIGRVNANHFTSWWIEAGTYRMAARAPLRRALEHVLGGIGAALGGGED